MPRIGPDNPSDAPRLPRRVIRVAIVVSRYNNEITDRLRDGAVEELARRCADRGRAEIVQAPGAFELPYLASVAARSGRFDAIVALGCIVKGETIHDRVLADAVTREMSRLAVDSGLPVGLGVLTVDTTEQARARAGGSLGNKGAEAMTAALDCIAAAARIGHSGRRGTRI